MLEISTLMVYFGNWYDSFEFEATFLLKIFWVFFLCSKKKQQTTKHKPVRITGIELGFFDWESLLKNENSKGKGDAITFWTQ